MSASWCRRLEGEAIRIGISLLLVGLAAGAVAAQGPDVVPSMGAFAPDPIENEAEVVLVAVEAPSGGFVGGKIDLSARGQTSTWTGADLGSWDQDRSGALDWEEWKNGLRQVDVFDGWDVNGDGLVEPAEYSNGLFDDLDLDQDNEISVKEHLSVGRFWYGSADRYGTHGTLDTNYDGVVDRIELDRAVVHGGLFRSWDEDASGLLNEGEFFRGVLGTWDMDGDGVMAVAESPMLGSAILQEGLAGIQPEP